MNYWERLRLAARARRSQLCVGLDPDPDRIPGGAGGALRHCLAIITATSDHACCYKPNAAYWEQYGPDGLTAVAELRAAVPDDIPVLYDAKRSDIGPTMAAYGAAVFGALGMDAVTVHAYHGLDSLEAVAGQAEKGVYVVCRTSNPGAADLQEGALDGVPLYLRVAELAERANRHGNLGLVVGGTVPDRVGEVRAASRLPFLIPGIGAQGGDLAGAVRAAWDGDEAGCLITASRSVMYAPDPGAAARRLQDDINRVLAAVA